MRKLYLGDPRGLERKLFDDIAAAKGEDPFFSVVVVVESNLAGICLRRALARCGSYCRVRFVTLPDLAADLASKMPDNASLKTLPPFGEEWLAALTVREAAGGYFGPVAWRPGFRGALLQTFQELEEAGLQQFPLPQGGDPQRIGELQRLFERYRQLRSPFAHRAGTFAAAARSTPEEATFLAICGLYALTTLEKGLLAALAVHHKMTVYWQKPAAASGPAGETLQWYEEKGFTIERLTPPSSGTNLARLQGNLFMGFSSETGPSSGGDMSLEFICAPDEVREVEEIVRGIIRQARNGVRFGEMAVLLPNYTYSHLIGERLDAAGIPFFLASGRSLARTRTGRSFLLLLKMMGGDYPRLEVVELLSHAPFDYYRLLGEGAPVSPPLWDYLTMQAGVIKGRLQWQEALFRHRRRLQHQLGEQEEEAAAERGRMIDQIAAIDALLAFLEIFFEALEDLGGCCSWRDLSTAAENIVLKLFQHGEEREALRRLLERLGRLDECGGKFHRQPALELLHSVVEAVTLPVGHFQQEGVNLLPLGSAAGLSFTALFIPGIAEKIIPSPVNTDPLLPEPERRALAGLLPLRRRKLELEALRFSLGVGGALQKAVLTWPRTAAVGGREQLPSFYLSRCGEALLGARPGYDELSLLPGYRYIPAAAQEETVEEPFTEAEYDLACCRRLPSPLQPVHYYCRLSVPLSRLIEADLARRRRRLSAYEGMFTPGGIPQGLLAARLAEWRRRATATALEDYARCPYSFFLKRLLFLAPLEEPEEVLAMALLPRGRLIHRILEQFYRRAAATGILPVERCPDECRILLRRVAGEEFAALPPEEVPPFPLLWQLQQRDFEETLRAFLEWEIKTAAGFMPQDFELAFGFQGSVSRAALRLPSGEEICFRGRIDRVDRRGDRIRVIDYKTGKKRNKDESLAGGEALQLPVYLLAAGSIFGLPQLDEAEAYAYHLSSEGVKTVLFSGKPWPQKEQLLQETAAVLFEGITDGRFFPFPNSGCRYCDYRAICGPGIERTFRLKEGDPLLEPFLRMKEENV